MFDYFKKIATFQDKTGQVVWGEPNPLPAGDYLVTITVTNEAEKSAIYGRVVTVEEVQAE